VATLHSAWRYPYFEEPELRRNRVVLRPVVPVSLGGMAMDRALDGLVDSGSESTLVASWVADLLGLDLAHPDDVLQIGVGGARVEARFVEVEMRLHRWPEAPDGEHVEWRAEVGFVTPWRPLYPVLLGQRGFFDEFTLTFSRHAQELMVEDVESYDARSATAP
jgi:hypothetical protein